MQFVEAVEFDQRRLDEGAARPLFLILRAAFGGLVYLAAFGAHRLNVAFDAGFGVGVDHWAHVGGQALRIAHAAFGHRAAQHLQRVLGHVFLNAQDTQRGAALAGAVEGGGHHVGHHLLGQGGRVDDHGIQAAGFGDQRRRAALRIQTTGDAALQNTGDVGGAGKHHAAYAGVVDQR